MDVSILIVNYHTSALINDCIASILDKVRDVDYEIIIVDNDTEDLTSAIKFAGDQRIRLLHLPENVGFGRANNAGAALARGRYLFLLNPDTLLLNDAVGILCRFLDTHPLCGACGGNLFDTDMSPALSFRRTLPGITWELNELLHCIPEKIAFGRSPRHNFTGKALKTAYITGADLMMPRKLFEDIGGFFPGFFMYYEETDLCNRIKKKGYSIWSVPQAEIQHLEGKSFNTGKVNETKFSYSEKGRLLYYSRNVGRISRWISDRIYRLFLMSRILLTKKPVYAIRLKFFKIHNSTIAAGRK